MTAKQKSLEPRSLKPNLPNNAEERIRRRAYELYEQRGGRTASPWTTGSKRRARFSGRRSNGRSKPREGLSVDGD